MFKYIKSMPTLRKHRDVFLFGSRGRFFDNLFLTVLKSDRTRIVYDVADIPHLQNFYFGGKVIDTSLARRFYSLINLADVTIFVSQSAPDLVGRYALRNKKTMIVPNASDPGFFKASAVQTDTKIILYVGGYSSARGVDDLVAAFNILKKKYPNVKLRLIGANMPLKFRSDRILVERDKVYKDMPKIFAESYLCVIPHKRNRYMDAALPVKLFDAMASARPIVTTDCSETKNLVKKEKCGIVSHDNPLSLADAMEYLILNPQIAKEIGNHGREAVLKRHSWKHRAEAIISNLRRFSDC